MTRAVHATVKFCGVVSFESGPPSPPLRRAPMTLYGKVTYIRSSFRDFLAAVQQKGEGNKR